jgi:RNA polymerase sigma factor (sigma-70 family)
MERVSYKQNGIVKVPEHVQEKIRPLISRSEGRKESINTIADNFTFKDKSISQICAAHIYAGIVNSYTEIYEKLSSNDGEYDSFESRFLTDEKNKTPEQNAIDSEIEDIVRQEIDKLPDFEKKVIVLRFGKNHHSLNEAAELLDCSRSKISVCEIRAKKSLKYKLIHRGIL